MENIATRSDKGKQSDMRNYMTNSDGAAQEIRDEALIHMAVRRELGPEYEDELVDSFVEKVQVALSGGRRNRGPAAGMRAELPNRPGASPAVLPSTICIGITLAFVATGLVGLPGFIAVCGAVILLAIYVDGDRPLRRNQEFQELSLVDKIRLAFCYPGNARASQGRASARLNWSRDHGSI